MGGGGAAVVDDDAMVVMAGLEPVCTRVLPHHPPRSHSHAPVVGTTQHGTHVLYPNNRGQCYPLTPENDVPCMGVTAGFSDSITSKEPLINSTSEISSYNVDYLMQPVTC